MSWGKELGTGLFVLFFSWGRRQPGEGRGERGIAVGELQSQPGLNCKVLRSRGAFVGSLWGPGLLNLQYWQTKSRKDRQLPAPGMNLPPSQLLLLSLGEFWGGAWGVLDCFAARVAPS